MRPVPSSEAYGEGGEGSVKREPTQDHFVVRPDFCHLSRILFSSMRGEYGMGGIKVKLTLHNAEVSSTQSKDTEDVSIKKSAET